MANLIGLVLFAYGGWLLYSGLQHRKRFLAAPPAAEDDDNRLAILAEVMPPLIMLALGIAALEVVLAYVMIGANPYFSLFDLLGVLFAIGSYGVWIRLRTRYRSGAQPTAGGDGQRE